MKDFQSLYHPELLKDETNAITEETEDLFETTVKEDLDEKAKEKKYAKANGKVPSPNFLVKTTLDLAGYQGQKILQKHVIDNSCGEGNFLVEIMRRYCLAFFEVNQDEKQLKYELETYLHGVEIDHLQVYNCRVNLNIALREFSLIWVKWDLWDEDATKVKFFNGKMDYVFANPPYVRSRYFSIDTSHYANFRYAQQGNSDLYLIFYEIGIEMLNETGVLGYISPCSIYNSLAGSAFRRDILELKLLSKVVNFEHYQWFKVATYTTIMILDRLHRDELMDYYRFNPKTLQLYLKDQLSYSQIAIDGIIYLGDKVNLALIKEIIETSKSVLPKLLVKNGIATTCDRFFVRSFNFSSQYIIPVLKAASEKMKQLFFPYRNNRLIDYEELCQDENIKNYLEQEFIERQNRGDSVLHQWYGFGRTQGIIDIMKPKIATNFLIRSTNELRIHFCPPGMAVMTGFYVLGDITVEELRQCLENETFLSYIHTISKYRISDYYSFSAKELKNFLTYWLHFHPLEREMLDLERDQNEDE